ncbi:putative membrane protein [Babesia divergens]|uniref:Membrane protein n=1 Tax=Babesia divergens TaxID=32595 RepID=A0AAD9GAF8_BABDI|nr:putative membrane protein [Babesia divergens]
MFSHSIALLFVYLFAVVCNSFVVRRASPRSFSLYGMRIVEPKLPKTTKRYCTTRAGKTEIIVLLKELLSRSKAILRFTYKRFTPNERLTLNKKLKPFISKGKDGSEEAAKLRMVKNTLMEKAMENTEWEIFAPRLHGPSMCCFIFNEEKLPHILSTFEKLRMSDKNIRRHVTLDSASYAGKVIEPPKLFELSNYASKNHLIARLMCALSGNTTRIACGLNSLATKLAVALNETTRPNDQGNVAPQENVSVSAVEEADSK